MNTKNFQTKKKKFLSKLYKIKEIQNETNNLLKENKEIIYEDQRDEILIEILKREKFDFLTFYIQLKKQKNIKLGIEPLIFFLGKRKFKLIKYQWILKILIENIEANKKYSCLNSPLMLALNFKHSENILKLLIKQENTEDLRDKYGESLFIHALKYNFSENLIESFIKKKETNFNQTDKFGQGLLMLALKYKYSYNILKLLIEKKLMLIKWIILIKVLYYML